MGQYQGLFERNAEQWEDLFAQYRENPFPVAKLNLYFTDPESRQRVEQQILDAEIPVTMAHAEATSLEISAKGVSKAVGLRKLCEHLHIPISETIAVGDAPNDLEVLKAAGLAVAMGNSRQQILDMADVVVSDCDHDAAPKRFINTYCAHKQNRASSDKLDADFFLFIRDTVPQSGFCG